MVSPFLPDAAKLRSVREAIPASGAGIYVNTAEAGPLPAETAAAMREIADHETRFGRGHAADLEDAAARRDEARAALAAVLAADVGSVALTRGSTDALAVALRGIEWSAGDRLVTVADAGPGIAAAAAGVVERRGVELVVADRRRHPADGTTTTAPLTELIVSATLDGDARLVVLPHVGVAGRRLPIAQLVAAIRSVRPDVPIVVDGRLAVGAVPVMVDELGVDAYAVGGDAWLLGPAATGGLWVAPSGRLHPDLAGPDALTPSGRTGMPIRERDARAFEPGELPTTSVVGLARSVGWLSMFVGLDWVLGRAPELAGRLVDRLAEIDAVELLTPAMAAERAAIVALRIRGWPAEEAVGELGRRIFAIAGVVASPDAGPPMIRLSTACFNEPSELDRLADAIGLLAAHTPDTLPRPTALTIVHG
ncbi:MAG TPA: aminotransferase class V-fold PLP-dependent enzyme [Candidatus Limnocylindrales bacterium]|nr:aminotransferase class V-fold PLP-dependent enzyme [Candidatus Limnocylindrales bacterium]